MSEAGHRRHVDDAAGTGPAGLRGEVLERRVRERQRGQHVQAMHLVLLFEIRFVKNSHRSETRVVHQQGQVGCGADAGGDAVAAFIGSKIGGHGLDLDPTYTPTYTMFGDRGGYRPQAFFAARHQQ